MKTLAMDIRFAIEGDIPSMVAMAEAKRVEYEGYSPLFWRKAPDSSSKQEQYFQSLLKSTDIIALVAQRGEHLAGFIVGALATAPPVYNPGGPVCIVDDFTVVTPEEWPIVGAALLTAVEHEARTRGAVLVVAVCAQRDHAKRALLQDAGLSTASEWYVRLL
jgi:hypothetical protein